MAHAAASSVLQFRVARFSLGIGESGSFPASIKAVAEWFPKKERAIATGLFNSGTNIGAIVGPALVAWITDALRVADGVHRDWRIGVRLDCGVVSCLSPAGGEQTGFASGVGDDSRVIIGSGIGECSVADSHAAAAKRGRLDLGKFFTDPIWWVYLFWMPDFLSRNLKLDLKGMRLPLFVIYSGASVGSIAGGWLSSWLLKTRMDRERQPEDGDAGVCAGGDADHAGGSNEQCMVCGLPCGVCCGGTPGMVCEHLHAGVRHVSAGAWSAP